MGISWVTHGWGWAKKTPLTNPLSHNDETWYICTLAKEGVEQTP